MKPLIYFDHHATTPIDPRVLEAMLPLQKNLFANAASTHYSLGKEVQEKIEEARGQVASLIGCDSEEVTFTSGATESNNLALKGIAEVYQEKGKHIITQVTEHPSVLRVCEDLEKKGFEVTYLPVDSFGKVNVEMLEKAVRPDTILISMMFANNEIGTIQPIQEIGKVAKEKNIFFHVDGAQAVGKIPFDVQNWGIDLLSFSAHKLYGPKGVGALYIRKKNPHVRLATQIHGGGHEEGVRSGTLNGAGIVGLGEACRIAQNEMKEESKRVGDLRDQLLKGIQSQLEEVHLNGHPQKGLWNNLNLSFPGLEGEAFLRELVETVAISTGSACLVDHREPSYVLKALGVPEEHIHTSIRFGLGRFNTAEEVDQVVEKVVEVAKRLREISPFA